MIQIYVCICIYIYIVLYIHTGCPSLISAHWRYLNVDQIPQNVWLYKLWFATPTCLRLTATTHGFGCGWCLRIAIFSKQFLINSNSRPMFVGDSIAISISDVFSMDHELGIQRSQAGNLIKINAVQSWVLTPCHQFPGEKSVAAGFKLLSMVGTP